MSGFDASADRSRRSPWAVLRYKSQADSLLDELLEDLEHSLEEGLVEEYPYWGTRPPLPLRRSSMASGILLGLALAATLVAGLAFWTTLRRRAGVFSQANSPWLRDPVTEASDSPNSDFRLAQEQEPSRPPEAGGKTPRDPSEEVSSQEPPRITLAEPEAKTTPVRPPAATAPTPAAATSASPPSLRSAPVRIPPQPPPQMKLVGLIHDPGAPKALILIDNVVRQVPVGQAVKAEWRVTSISPYGVRVSNGAQSVTLQLGLSQRL